MDYKKLAAAIKLCGSEPSVRRCEKECAYIDARGYLACGGELEGRNKGED